MRVAAVCDVYEPHVRRAQSATDGKADVYHDFRKVLDRKDIDAVVIATPDHWHAIPTILACQAGKDVYCEKPLTHRLNEGRAVVKAAEKHERVTQMGNLIHAGENYHRVAEIVQSGVLGTISKTRVWMAADRSGLGKPADGDPPAGLRLRLLARPRPEACRSTRTGSRSTGDTSGTTAAASSPTSAATSSTWSTGGWRSTPRGPSRASGGRFALDDNGETPDTLEVAYEYEKDGHELPHGLEPDRRQHARARGHGPGHHVPGDRRHARRQLQHPQDHPREGPEIPDVPKTLPRSVGHHREWLNAIKSREQCSCNFAYGHRLSSVGHLGNVALHVGEKLKWDADAERITNHPEANQLLTKEYRRPWTLPEV